MTMAASPMIEKLYAMVATSAIYNGERDKTDDYTRVCHPGTRGDLLRDLTAWANNPPLATRVEWYNAIAGAGKTAMLRTFCTDLEARSYFPPISFFVWKGDARRNTLKHFPATIALQLCSRTPALVPYVESAIYREPFLLQSTFNKQMDELVITPLLNASNIVKEEGHLIIVVDGLDGLDENGLSEFLNFIPNFISRLSSLPISVLVSSRPEDMIVGAFQHPKLASITRTTRIGASDVDILKFLDDKFDEINLRFPYLQIKYGGRWPSDKQRAIMVRQSSGLFIWPTVAISYIDKVALGLGHNKRLEQVLSSTEPKPWIASPLDNLYRAILQAHAPEDAEDLLHFNQRLAYLCLPVGFGMFLRKFRGRVVDWSDIPIRAVLDETLDELWGSVAGLSSLFSPREPLSEDVSPTPHMSHRSLRDFTFNLARCGDKFYYSGERELHTEIVCKFFKFFNTRQAYQNWAEMSTRFIDCTGKFLESHFEEAAVSEELGRCMDDVMLEVIPPTWPFVTQMYLIANLFNGLYAFADSPGFPEGSRRREVLLSKLASFFKSRAGTAEEWDIALFRLALSATDFEYNLFSYHSVHCWHVVRSPRCTCEDAYMRNISLADYQHVLANSTLFQHAKWRLQREERDEVARDSSDVLQFFVSLSETSQRATQISSFIPVIDYWIGALLKYCPPTDNLYNTLGPICTASLLDLPRREEDDSLELVGQFLEQTEALNKYAIRCQEVGIETNFPPIKVPDDWWDDLWIRDLLLSRGYKWPNARTSPTPPSGPQMTILESDALSQVSSSSQPQPLPASSSKPPSTKSNFDTDFDGQQAISPIDVPSRSAACSFPIPDSAPGTNGSITDTGAHPIRQRRRSRVKTVFKRLFRWR